MTERFLGVRRWARLFVFGAAAVWIASLWNPFYVTPPVEGGTFVEVGAGRIVNPSGPIGPVLSDGVALTQRVYADALSEFPEGGIQRTICANVSFVTFERQNAGQIIATVTVGVDADQFVVDAAEIEDWQDVPFCIERAGGIRPGDAITLTLTGLGAGPDASVAPLLGTFTGFSQGLWLPAELRRQPGQSLPTPLTAPLRIKLTATDLVAARTQDTPFLDRALTWALPLGLPMVVAVLVVVLLTLELIPQRSSEVETAGIGLLLAGLLVLSIGLNPAVSQRTLVPVLPGPPSSPASQVMRLPDGVRIEQVVAAVDVPMPSELQRDGRGRRERLCVALPLVRSDPDVPLDGMLEIVLSSGHELSPGITAGRRELADTVALKEVTDGRAIACFRVGPSTLQATRDVRVGVQLASGSTSETLSLQARALRGGETPLRAVGQDIATPRLALDLEFLRETPTYRESVFARIGQVALAAGVILLGWSSLRGGRLAGRWSGRGRFGRREGWPGLAVSRTRSE